MLLVIDVGNTNIVLGAYEGDDLLYDWRIATSKDRTSDEYGMLVEQILNHNGIKIEELNHVIISSVVPSLMHTLSAMCIKYLQIEPLIVGPGVKTGMNIKYDNPREVGADRIVNAVAGYEKYGGPLIIVDIGTAITFCAISREGDYLGGAIVPGISISAEALFLRTAKLPKVEIAKPDHVIAKNTVNSIQAGIVYGYIGLVDRLIEKMIEELGEEDVKVIATGGFSSLIAAESKYIEEIDKLLTLEGLKKIFERNI